MTQRRHMDPASTSRSLAPRRPRAPAHAFASALALVGALALGACPVERGKRFQHVTHAGAGLACKSCHDKVFTPLGEGVIASIGTDEPKKPNLYPSDDKCISCHRAPHPGKSYVGECARCHGDAARDVKKGDGPSHIIFDHKGHEKTVKGQCFPCHTRITTHATPFGRLTPSMATCNTCHQKDFDAMACGMCHARLDMFPIKPVSDFAHAGDFMKSHGRVAASRPELCAQCHTQPYCATCHDPKNSPQKLDLRWPLDIEKGFIHRGDYVGRHAIEARTSGDTCVRCHAVKECTACHDQRGFGQGRGRNPHPPNWVSVAGGRNLHGRAARREVVSCAGCHDQGAASNCVRCHRVGGVGGNPHPPGFKSRLSKTRDVVCRICH